MTKFTPWPWKLKFKKDCDWSIYGKNGYSVLAIPHDDEHGDTPIDMANAALIAAAPSLYKELEIISSLLCAADKVFWKKDIDSIDELLKKARGEYE